MADLPASKWEMIDKTEFESASNASTGTSLYFAASNDAGEARRTRAIHILSVVVMSKFIYERTLSSVEYGDYEDFSEVVYRNSVNYCYLKSMKATNTKAYSGTASSKYMSGLHDGLCALISKANSGSGRGIGRSTFDDDIPVLVDLSLSVRKIDDILQHFGTVNETIIIKELGKTIASGQYRCQYRWQYRWPGQWSGTGRTTNNAKSNAISF